MGGGGNGDSRRNDKMNTSDLVFILNPNRRPFLTPKFGVSDCMISSAFYQSHSQPQAYYAISAQEYQQLSPRGCQLNPPQEYQFNPQQEYQLNPPQEYHLNPPQEYQLNSPHGYQLNSSLTADESISSMEIEESTFPSSDCAQPGYSSPPFPSKDDSCGVHLSYPSSSPQKDDSGGESPHRDDSGGESPQKYDRCGESPQKDDRCGESPQKDDSGCESPQKDDRCGESTQNDDSDGDKHVPLAARRLMNHNKPGEKELLPRRRKQKRRIE